MTLLEVSDLDLSKIRSELSATVQRGKSLFLNAPVVICLERLENTDTQSSALDNIVSLCRELKLLPVAVRGGDNALRQFALEHGLALMPKSRQRATTENEQEAPATVVELPAAVHATETDATVDGEKAANTAPQTSIENSAPKARKQPESMVVTNPVRSGQQIYANEGRDLIITSAVSAGAEVLADGNIHVYGPLRGRALAGVLGNEDSRIFCQSLEADLVSIAGIFMINEDLRKEFWQKPVQISMKNNSLSIEPLHLGR